MYYKSGQLLQIGHNNKCRVLLTRDTDVTAKIGEFDVKNSGQKKLLGVKIDTKHFFQKLCFFPLQKSKPDVNALARVVNFMDLAKRKNLIKAFITPQFNYCALISMCHSRQLNN